MHFVGRGSAKLTAKVTGSTKTISLDGVTPNNTTPENAKAQADKLLDIVNKSVQTSGMTRSVIEEAVE